MPHIRHRPAVVILETKIRKNRPTLIKLFIYNTLSRPQKSPPSKTGMIIRGDKRYATIRRIVFAIFRIINVSTEQKAHEKKIGALSGPYFFRGDEIEL